MNFMDFMNALSMLGNNGGMQDDQGNDLPPLASLLGVPAFGDSGSGTIRNVGWNGKLNPPGMLSAAGNSPDMPMPPQAPPQQGMDLNSVLREVGNRINMEGFQNPDNPGGAMQGVVPKAEGPKGMFGIKGTGRDILGLLGDAFLVQGGGDPIYQQSRRQEQLGEAYQDFTKDPMGAIAKIGAIDSDLGYKLYNAYAQDQGRMARIAETVRNNQFRNSEKLFTAAGGLLAAATPSTYPVLMERLKSRAASIGDPAMFDGLPKDYDKEAIAQWARGTMNRYQQGMEDYRGEMVALGEDRLEETKRSNQVNEGIRQQNADTSASRANKPRKVGEYVRRSDGKKVVMYDDGSEVVGTEETRPTGRQAGRGRTSTPPPADLPKPRRKGDKITNRRTGVTYTSEDGINWR